MTVRESLPGTLSGGPLFVGNMASQLSSLPPRSLKSEMRVQIANLRNSQNYCADCFSSDPEWASTNLAIFICVACCGVHRHLGTHISRVKSIKLDDWTPTLLRDMQVGSNRASNRHYLKCFPLSFKCIDQSDPAYLREEIIKNKYLREMYVEGTSPEEVIPFKVGYLQKRGKYSNKWATRFVKLSNGSLIYYKNQDDIDKELGRVQVDKVWISDGKTGRNFTLQIIGTSDRSIFVQFENAKELLEWLNLIRLAKAVSLSKTLTSGNVVGGLEQELLEGLQSFELLDRLENIEMSLRCSLVLEGYLDFQICSAEYPKKAESGALRKLMGRSEWKKVFGTLTHDKLYLYSSPLDATPLDVIRISQSSVDNGQFEDNEFLLTRSFSDNATLFRCESPVAKRRWVHSITACAGLFP